MLDSQARHYLVTSVTVSKEEPQPAALEAASDPESRRKPPEKDRRLCHLERRGGGGHCPRHPGKFRQLGGPTEAKTTGHKQCPHADTCPTGWAGPWPSRHPGAPPLCSKRRGPCPQTGFLTRLPAPPLSPSLQSPAHIPAGQSFWDTRHSGLCKHRDGRGSGTAGGGGEGA